MWIFEICSKPPHCSGISGIYITHIYDLVCFKNTSPFWSATFHWGPYFLELALVARPSSESLPGLQAQEGMTLFLGYEDINWTKDWRLYKLETLKVPRISDFFSKRPSSAHSPTLVVSTSALTSSTSSTCPAWASVFPIVFITERFNHQEFTQKYWTQAISVIYVSYYMIYVYHIISLYIMYYMSFTVSSILSNLVDFSTSLHASTSSKVGIRPLRPSELFHLNFWSNGGGFGRFWMTVLKYPFASHFCWRAVFVRLVPLVNLPLQIRRVWECTNQPLTAYCKDGIRSKQTTVSCENAALNNEPQMYLPKIRFQ